MMVAEMVQNVEQIVIGQLKKYKILVGRIKMLEKVPIGNGMYLSSRNQEDKLQDLHRKLRGMPSYMYLTAHEQRLEQAATAYLTKYPEGTRSQLRAIREAHAVDEEDEELLGQVAQKIKKIIEVRRGEQEGFHGVIERVSELQELQREKEIIDYTLDLLEFCHHKHYASLLRLRYIDGKSVEETASELNIARKTFDRWRMRAIDEYAKIAGIAEI